MRSTIEFFRRLGESALPRSTPTYIFPQPPPLPLPVQLLALAANVATEWGADDVPEAPFQHLYGHHAAAAQRHLQQQGGPAAGEEADGSSSTFEDDGAVVGGGGGTHQPLLHRRVGSMFPTTNAVAAAAAAAGSSGVGGAQEEEEEAALSPSTPVPDSYHPHRPHRLLNQQGGGDGNTPLLLVTSPPGASPSSSPYAATTAAAATAAAARAALGATAGYGVDYNGDGGLLHSPAADSADAAEDAAEEGEGEEEDAPPPPLPLHHSVAGVAAAHRLGSVTHRIVTAGAPAAHTLGFRSGGGMGAGLARLFALAAAPALTSTRELAANAAARELEDLKMELKLRADIVAVQAVSVATAAFAAAVSAALANAVTAPSARRILELHRRSRAWAALRPAVGRAIGRRQALLAGKSGASGGASTPTHGPPHAASPAPLPWADLPALPPFPGATLSLCLRHAFLAHEENEGVRSLRQWGATGFPLGWACLLSAVGKEKGMLDDARFGAASLSLLRFMLVDAGEDGFSAAAAAPGAHDSQQAAMAAAAVAAAAASTGSAGQAGSALGTAGGGVAAPTGLPSGTSSSPSGGVVGQSGPPPPPPAEEIDPVIDDATAFPSSSSAASSAPPSSSAGGNTGVRAGDDNMGDGDEAGENAPAARVRVLGARARALPLYALRRFAASGALGVPVTGGSSGASDNGTAASRGLADPSIAADGGGGLILLLPVLGLRAAVAAGLLPSELLGLPSVGLGGLSAPAVMAPATPATSAAMESSSSAGGAATSVATFSIGAGKAPQGDGSNGSSTSSASQQQQQKASAASAAATPTPHHVCVLPLVECVPILINQGINEVSTVVV